MEVKFWDKENWEDVVDFKSLIDAIVEFVKNILKFEFGFDLDAE